MLMQDTYRPHFMRLTMFQRDYLCQKVTDYHQFPEKPSSSDLLLCVDEAGLDHADVVMSLATDKSKIGVETIETLIGKPIVRKMNNTPKERKTFRNRQNTRKVDNRIILEVVPNPKKKGSAAYQRFTLYKVGLTVNKCMNKGVSARDIRHDSKNHFIKLGDAK